MTKKNTFFRRYFGWLAINSRPLYCQWSLWIVIALVTSGVGYITWRAVRDLPYDPSSAGVQNVLKITSPILGLAGFGVAIIVLVARMHTTKQTHDQIVLAQQANTFNNYLLHHEHFVKVLSGLENEYIDAKSTDFSVLYQELYPQNGPKYFTTDMNEFRGFPSRIHYMAHHVNEAIEQSIVEPDPESRRSQIMFSGGVIRGAMQDCLMPLKIRVNDTLPMGMESVNMNWDTGRINVLSLQVAQYFEFLVSLAKISGVPVGEILPRYLGIFNAISFMGGEVTHEIWERFERMKEGPLIPPKGILGK